MDARFEPGGAPGLRTAAVRADREPGCDHAPVLKPRPDGVRPEIVSLDRGRDALDAPSLSDRGPERLGHPIVLDVPSERVEPDFRGEELDRARRKQRSRVVDETQAPQGRGLRLQARPQAEGIKKGDGLVEQGDGAPVSGPLGQAARDDVEARLGQTESRG